MQNKKTLLFFTDRYNTAVAENIIKEYSGDNSVLGVIITRKELANFVVNAMWELVLPDESKARNFIHNKRIALGTLNSKRIPPQNTTFSHRDRRQKRILNALHRYNPDVVAVTTHTVLFDVLSAVERYGQGVKVVVIGEEFVLDRRLIQRNVDYYFVDNYDMRNLLAEGGIPDEKIEIASLPIGKEYFERNNREEAVKKFALDDMKPTILISASTYGDSRFKKVLEEIKKEQFDTNIVVACGKDRALLNVARELEFTAYNEGIDMNAALNACDILVARPTTMLMGAAIVKSKSVLALLPSGVTESANLKYLSIDSVTKIDDTETLILRLRDFINEFYDKQSAEYEENADMSAPDRVKRVPEEKKIAPIEQTSARRIATKLLEFAEERDG